MTRQEKILHMRTLDKIFFIYFWVCFFIFINKQALFTQTPSSVFCWIFFSLWLSHLVTYLQAGVRFPLDNATANTNHFKNLLLTRKPLSPTAWLCSLSQLYVIRAESLAVMDLWPENDPIVVPTCGLRDAAVGHRCTDEDLMDYYDRSRASVFVSVFVSAPVRYRLRYGLCRLLHADGWALLAGLYKKCTHTHT